jgi:hypothetical protein
MPRPTSSLSQKPEHIRKRLRRREVPLKRDLEMLANTRKPINEWDTEELARGRPRDKDGTFRGVTPKWITPLIMDEAKRRLKVGALETLSSKVIDAIEVIHKLMMSDERDSDGKPIVDARTRLQAAQFIIEHTIGKARQPVDMNGSADGYRQFLAGALKMVDTNGQLVDAHPVIEGTAVETEADE